jgi:hypothetical protein
LIEQAQGVSTEFRFLEEEPVKITNQRWICKPFFKSLRKEEEELQNYFFYTEIFKDFFKK